MATEQDDKIQIALNVTRTRVTVLAFNLALIAIMLSLLSARDASAEYHAIEHLVSSTALFVGFCLTLLGLWWLLVSQNQDAEGFSHPLPFTLGAITIYLALSQTVNAFMHEYLVRIASTVVMPQPGIAEGSQGLVRLDVLGDTGFLFLVVMGGATWVLMTYVAPLITVLRSPLRSARRWMLTGYYFALQVPIYLVYAESMHLQYQLSGQPKNILSLFAFQFLQPLLWFR